MIENKYKIWGDILEILSKYDFYLKFKPIYRSDGKFVDYLLTYISDNFYENIGINPNIILNKKLSEIVVDTNKLGFKEFYFNIIPKAKIKYELYIQELDRWFIINVFTDMSNSKEYMITSIS